MNDKTNIPLNGYIHMKNKNKAMCLCGGGILRLKNNSYTLIIYFILSNYEFVIHFTTFSEKEEQFKKNIYISFGILLQTTGPE